MTAKCVTPIKGSVMRLVKLDPTCGCPVTGASSAEVVTNGFIRITPSPQYTDGQTQQVQLADGSYCVDEQDDPTFSRVNLNTLWCVMDPDALVIITGDRLLTTGGVTGTGLAFEQGLVTARFSLEVWQKVTGKGACTAAGLQNYVYWAFPNVGGTKVNDYNIENAPLQLSTTSFTRAACTSWGTTPGSAGPWIADPVQENDHFLYNVTTTPPPAASCGASLLV